MNTATRSSRRAGRLALRRIVAIGLVVAGVSALAGWSSTAAHSGTPSAGIYGTDDGAKLTLWTRDATQAASQLLVTAYNKTHKNKVKLTVIPSAQYQAKIGTAAGSGGLPDLFASDIVYSPNFATKHLWLDITSRLKALPFYKKIAPGALGAGTINGRRYVVPHVIDTSILFYNKGLYSKAGLDPNKPPKTLAQFAAQAAAITKYGNGNYGTYFAANCPGCLAFTWWPSMWADGATLVSKDGKAAFFASAKAKAVLSFYRTLYASGSVAPGADTETGATWVSAFAKGNIGIMPMPSSTLDSMPKTINIGVAPIPGLSGGASTFVGGDVLGISSSSKHANEAWNFIAWTLRTNAQVNVMAKNHYQLARTDLSGNKYTSSDPRLIAINKVLAKGQLPVALNYGQTFNDSNGPWLTLARDAVFGDASKIDADNAAISKSLAGG